MFSGDYTPVCVCLYVSGVSEGCEALSDPMHNRFDFLYYKNMVMSIWRNGINGVNNRDGHIGGELVEKTVCNNVEGVNERGNSYKTKNRSHTSKEKDETDPSEFTL